MDRNRYQKQMLFAGIGEAGQQRLNAARVTLIGCGALGCVLADSMVRAGVGLVRIVDRDFVEFSNLQRQTLFTEADVISHLPKATAAAARLKAVNSQIQIEPIVADADFRNIRSLAEGADLILDGTDNFEIRYLINDVCLESGIPWIFTGCTGSNGQMMPIFPNRSACLRCLIPDPPPAGIAETCDTAGVLGPAIGAIASMQAALALRILAAERNAGPSRDAADGGSDSDSSDNPPRDMLGVPLKLTMLDVWDGTFRQMDVSSLRQSSDCPACRHGQRLWLSGARSSGSHVMCGRNAVQISPPEPVALSLTDLANRLQSAGIVTSNAFLVRLALAESGLEMTVFPDGRAIVKGTEDPHLARSTYSRYVGS